MYKILIVDDEKMIRMGIKKVIDWEALGICEVFTASSAREALEIIEEYEPEIMITDIQMSEMTGLQLIEAARKRQPRLRVLVLTGYDSFEYARQSLRLQVQDLFLKPVDEEVLSKAVKAQVEYLEAPNNMENESLGSRKLPFGKELYIEREDFMIDPPKKYKRLFLGTEVRLMNAYFVTCTGFEADDDGTVRVVHCTYDPATKGGNAPDGRKVKGTIHWVEASQAGKVTVRLYENIVDEEKGVYNKEDGSLNLNPNSLTTVSAYVEPELMKAKGYDSYQFVRNGFFCADIHDSKEGQPVFNRIVSLKSSFKLPKA